MPKPTGDLPVGLVRDHSRSWQSNRFVYPVISRRSRGLSIGVNLNPDTACNFDCIYCQVDRRSPDRGARMDLQVLGAELEAMLDLAVSGRLFLHPRFARVPPDNRTVRDIAFSGDGEPTTCPVFPEAVVLVAGAKERFGLGTTSIVLITDACYLTAPRVREALAVMDAHQGEIWAKLDAGTEEYYRRICRPNVPLSTVLENILDAARARPVVIQSLWMNVEGQPPPEAEIRAFTGRLNEIQSGGGRIKLVQVYTVARPPAEACVTALSRLQVERIARTVESEARVPAKPYFAPDDGGE